MKTIVLKSKMALLSLFKIKGDPKRIAKGFALGSFIGMLPFPGFQVFISAGLASILRFNKTAAITGVFNTNLATGAFIFAFNHWLGKTILRFESTFSIPKRINLGFVRTVLDAGFEVFLSLLVGGIITGVISMLLGYHILLYILKKKNIHTQQS